jgi:small subunit ribosomal protein S18
MSEQEAERETIPSGPEGGHPVASDGEIAGPASTTEPAAEAPSEAAKVRRAAPQRRWTPRRKVCGFCAEKVAVIDYKDVNRLRRYLSERGKIEPRRKTGTCAGHQRQLAVAIKRARHLGLLPFVVSYTRTT